VTVKNLPKCDCCQTEDAIFDIPTKHGPWGSLCPACADKIAAPSAMEVGSRYVIREPANRNGRKNEGKPVNGIEFTEDLEALVFGEVDREIECPECNTLHTVEPDADYVYTCEGCGAKVKCPVSPLF
jgi:ribosomal protein S27E